VISAGDIIRQGPELLKIVGFILLLMLIFGELFNTSRLSGDRIVIHYGLVKREIRLNDIEAMRMARGPFDGIFLGERLGSAFFANRLIIRLAGPRWFSTTVHLKGRNAREILAAFNAYKGIS